MASHLSQAGSDLDAMTSGPELSESSEASEGDQGAREQEDEYKTREEKELRCVWIDLMTRIEIKCWILLSEILWISGLNRDSALVQG